MCASLNAFFSSFQHFLFLSRFISLCACLHCARSYFSVFYNSIKVVYFMVFFLFRHSTYSFGNIIENYCYCDSVLKVCKRINSNFFEKLFRFAAIPQSKLNATGETGEERNVDNNWKMVASCGCLRENSMSHFVSYTLFFFYMYHRSVVATHLRRRHFFLIAHRRSPARRTLVMWNTLGRWCWFEQIANCSVWTENRFVRNWRKRKHTDEHTQLLHAKHMANQQ